RPATWDCHASPIPPTPISEMISYAPSGCRGSDSSQTDLHFAVVRTDVIQHDIEIGRRWLLRLLFLAKQEPAAIGRHFVAPRGQAALSVRPAKHFSRLPDCERTRAGDVDGHH